MPERVVNVFKQKWHRGKQIADYYPKSIGLSLPANIFDYEFLISGDNAPYNQNQVMKVFVDHGAMIQALDSSTSVQDNKFTLSLCCNLEHADLGPRDLAIQLQSMKFVNSAEYCEIRGRLFGRRLAGISFNNKQNAVALHSGLMIGLGRRLARETGSIGTAALYQEGRAYAHDVIREIGQILKSSEDLGSSPDYSYDKEDISGPAIEAYCVKCRKMRRIVDSRQVVLSNKSHALQGSCHVCCTKVFKIGTKVYGRIRASPIIENAQAFLMATGWGVFELRSAIDRRFGSVTISNPPTLEDDIAYGNQFLQGIAGGLLETASDTKNRMELVGEKYDPTTKTLSLHFAEQIPVKPRSFIPRHVREVKALEEEAPKTISEEVKEVDRIIRSIEKIESEMRSSLEEKQQEQIAEEGNKDGPTIAEPAKA